MDQKLAHDLTNMLTVVMANARLVRRNTSDLNRSAELAESIESQAHRALLLIHEAATGQPATPAPRPTARQAGN
jgi:K+-sensing histidine kinase KdpD